jgi:ABC-2 type transport system permease protein
MGPYLAIVSARFRMLLQYRAAAIAGLWTQVFFGFVLIMVYEAFYRSTDAPQPLSFPQLASYVWLGQALLATLPWNADPELRAMVRSGAVAYELCRPVDLYALWFARALAWRTAPTVLRAAPMAFFAIAVLPWLGLPEWRLAPPSPAAGLAFALALCAALALSCAISTLIHITLLWTVSGDGMVMLLTAATSLFSGLIIPLPLFPDGLRAVLEWLPFAGVADQPYRVYTGNLPPGELGLVLARQLAWTVLLIALGRWLIGRGVRRLVVQGG